jgi:branched-chain amino acid transport system substrate-binding protein
MKRTAAALLSVSVLGLTTACGTRLPDRSFAPALVGAGTSSSAAATGTPSDAAVTEPGVATGTAGVPTDSTGSVLPTSAASSAAQPTGSAATSARPTAKGTTTAPSQAGRTSAKATASKGVNTASDRGVTPTTITLGNIVSAGGIFGTEQFAVSRYGVLAFFNDLNTRGGINGRKVVMKVYNDKGDGAENVNVTNQAIDTDKVFALVGNNIFQYDGADKVQSTATPDIGGQPIKAIYYKYSHLFNILGTNVPRDNKNLGFNGFEYGTSENGVFFKEKVGTAKVGIVYYDQADSQRGAAVFAEGFRQAGLPVSLYPVNLGLPNFANTVAQMQADNVDTIADAMDANGNAKLCQAMEGNSAFIGQVKAKISTISTWSQRIPSEFKQTPKCRNLIYVTGSTRSYSDTADPAVAKFRDAMRKYFPSRESLMAQWTFEGWIAAAIFTEAASSCGVNLTRSCVEAYLTKQGREFFVGGLTNGFSWEPMPESNFAGKTKRQCTSVARWSDAKGTFVTVGDISKDCYTTNYYKYEIT